MEKDISIWGVGKKKGVNVNMLNYVLSHARYAILLRRNLAHLRENTSRYGLILNLG